MDRNGWKEAVDMWISCTPAQTVKAWEKNVIKQNIRVSTF